MLRVISLFFLVLFSVTGVAASSLTDTKTTNHKIPNNKTSIAANKIIAPQKKITLASNTTTSFNPALANVPHAPTTTTNSIKSQPVSTTTKTANTIKTASNTVAITPQAITPAANPTVASNANATQPAVLDTQMIDKITGLNGHYDKQTDSYKITLPRNDLKITLNGVRLSPAMGLTSWAVFQKLPNATTVKADLVVTENQVNTILNLALDNHLAVIALHNHLLWETPKVMFIHVEGAGDEKELAEAIKTVFTKTMDTNDEASDFPLAAIDASDTTLNPGLIETALGIKGAYKDGVYMVHAYKNSGVKPDPAVTAKNTTPAKPVPIISTSATFAGSNSEGVVDGDISLHASDLHVVLKALHKAGIAVVALHEHESNNTENRMVFVHYFGVGKTTTLARGLRSALDAAKANDLITHTPVVALVTTPPALVTPPGQQATATKISNNGVRSTPNPS